VRALVVTWGPGGNLPPMLAVASLLAGRGHEVTVLASGETRGAASDLGLAVVGYDRTPDPDVSVPFEDQAEPMMATAAGEEVALDARDAIRDLRPALVVVDCMLPAALAAARALHTPACSLVHFAYGLARTQMERSGNAWTTDLRTLAATCRALGVSPPRDGRDAWESYDLVLVSAPRWFDLDACFPAHVAHAGPLGVSVPPGASAERRRVLLSLSTTRMRGQERLVERACEAAASLNREALLTLGPAVPREAVRIPDGVEVVAAADHDALMPDAAAVVGHGGLGTVLRALAHGAPQLILPLGRDQAFNGSRVEGLGAGIALPGGASPADIRGALEALVAEPRYAEAAAAAARRIRADDPDRSAAEALEGTLPLSAERP
jgi:UDP:flavonoid glycosyltransferase YjiC (YdhE family)